MIQEKDFLYRVPVKTAPITTPRGQIRNPEILVDLEGGEFMHGNILDANSTNKLINQSVKEAVDNKLVESGYVTKDLLEAETSARTKGDEDLGAKIKAEQTRAEGKEKELSDKLAIVDGDSDTEGSFRKAIEGKQDKGNYITYSAEDQYSYTIDKSIKSVRNGLSSSLTERALTFNGDRQFLTYSVTGIDSSMYNKCLATSDNTFKPISDFASAEQLQSVEVGLSAKQNKITVNEVDVTDIETADITKLRTIVTNLINALSKSNLIRETVTIE